jgi:hypothetical protein
LRVENKEINKLFAWDIVEYYGLASTSLGGEWNPLVRNGAIHLQLKSVRHASLNYFFVVIGDCLVVMDLSEKFLQE